VTENGDRYYDVGQDDGEVGNPKYLYAVIQSPALYVYLYSMPLIIAEVVLLQDAVPISRA
jgi:hypothetical protein